MFNYTTNFNLTDEIYAEFFEDAVSYLIEDDMAQYVPENLKAKIVSVEWVLEELDEGVIVIWTKELLSEEEEDELSEWIAGQCSDGLGEGFEQQPFAEIGGYDYYNEYDYYDEYDEYEDYYDEFYMVSFSRADKYKLVLKQR